MERTDLNTEFPITIEHSRASTENAEKLGQRKAGPHFSATDPLEEQNGPSPSSLASAEHSENSTLTVDAVEPDLSPEELTRGGPRSSLRIKYEAEVSRLKKRIGSLESMRLDLGLSQRKMCQLLMVDPSAWTRWTRIGNDAPPHIYRMLQWYLAVEEKYPVLDIQFWLSNLTRGNPDREWEREVAGLSKSVGELNDERMRNSHIIRSLEIRLRESETAQKEAREALAQIENTVEKAQSSLDSQIGAIAFTQLKSEEVEEKTARISESESQIRALNSKLQKRSRKNAFYAALAFLFGALISYVILKHSV